MMINKHFFKFLITLLFLIGVIPFSSLASNLPTAAGSPIAGIAFDDSPLMLPDHRNFQMAMITASSEMGRSCGKMESYGWRLSPEEQNRVNLIFNNTVDRLRAQGFTVQSHESKNVSFDVTLFTADRADKHLLTLWSAGEIGLVMVLCETSKPVAPTSTNFILQENKSSVTSDHIKMAKEVRSGIVDKPVQLTRTGKVLYEDFTPKGKWTGKYTCIQGTTGATLSINSLRGDQFKGTFSFYPTDKNPFVPKGKYKVFGEYDRDSQRILMNPGKWIKRPKGYYNTIMIGSFDPVNMTFSAYFQGITGCTSFEAKYDETVHKKIKKKKKKKIRKKRKHVKKHVKKKTIKKKAKKIVKKIKKEKPVIVKKSNKLEVKKDNLNDSIRLDSVE